VLDTEKEGLPTTVRGLIDYPLERPSFFTVDVGPAPWSVWNICCAFAEQYARIYEQPEKYGVWGPRPFRPVDRAAALLPRKEADLSSRRL